MAHITSEEYLNKSNIEEYLDALAATLKTNGISAKDVMEILFACTAMNICLETMYVRLD